MATAERDQRTLPATPRRRDEARRGGSLPRSPDTGPALGVIALVVAWMVIGAAVGRVIALFEASLFAAGSALALTPTLIVSDMGGLVVKALLTLAPALAAGWVIEIVGLIATQGVALVLPRLALDRINPLQGFSRLFSPMALAQLGVSIVKVVAVGGVAAVIAAGPVIGWSLHPFAPIGATLAAFSQTLGRIIDALGLAAVVVGGISLVLARRRYEADLRMTREEMREEMRRFEGDPTRRRRQRQEHRRYTRQRLVQAVQAADVVIANPTHVAVALLYRPEEVDAPEVLAKGADRIAFRMRELAREFGVPVVENVPLARTLYADVEIGQTIPPSLFSAVAEVLAYVYRTRGFGPSGPSGPSGPGGRGVMA